MDLAQTRIVASDVAGLTAFYAALICVDVVANAYYVELPAGSTSLAFCRRLFNEPDDLGGPSRLTATDKVVLDFQVDDVDAHFERVNRLGVEWITAPTTQPWGKRSMMFRDPEGNVINVFSPTRDQLVVPPLARPRRPDTQCRSRRLTPPALTPTRLRSWRSIPCLTPSQHRRIRRCGSRNPRNARRSVALRA